MEAIALDDELKIWDDAELLRRSSTLAMPLFSRLRRAAALRPWVWLLALWPLGLCLAYQPFTESNAIWGLRALDAHAERDGLALFFPAELSVESADLRFEPPLITWLSAAILTLTGTDHAWGYLIPAGLGVALLILAGYHVGRVIGGPQLGVLGALFLACNPFVHRAAIVGNPAAWGVGLSALSLLWLERHYSRKQTWLSWSLWGSILALAGTLLMVGTGVVAPVLVAVIHVLTAPKVVPTRRFIIPTKQERCAEAWICKSLLVWLLAGTILTAWWPIVMTSLFGARFLWVWSEGIPFVAPVLTLDGQFDLSDWARSVFRTVVASWPLLLGFLLPGIGHWQRVRFQTTDPAAARLQHWLGVWSGAGLLGWLGMLRSGELQNWETDFWLLFMILPVTLIVAQGVWEIADRYWSLRWSLVAFSLGTALTIWRFRGAWLDTTQTLPQSGLLGVLILVLGLGLWFTTRSCRGLESRARRLLELCLIVFLLGGCLIGASFTPKASEETRELMKFWRELREWKHAHQQLPPRIDKIQILSETHLPSSLELVIRGSWSRLPVEISQREAPPRQPPMEIARLVIMHGPYAKLGSRTASTVRSQTLVGRPHWYFGSELTATYVAQ